MEPVGFKKILRGWLEGGASVRNQCHFPNYVRFIVLGDLVGGDWNMTFIFSIY